MSLTAPHLTSDAALMAPLVPSLEGRTAEDVLRWVEEHLYPARLACSFAGESVVLVDMIARVAPGISTFTIDTGRLPEETYELVDRIRDRYEIEIEMVYPRHEQVESMVREKGPYSFRRSIENRQECCSIRKVEPLRRALTGAVSWVTGLRRGQSEGRAQVPVGSWDLLHGLVKVNPLASWSREDVWAYIREHDVPYNRLYDQGYTSIGCAPCTRATLPGEESRAGRWWWEHEDDRECGLHR